MGAGIGVGDEATHLPGMIRQAAQKGEHRGRLVPWLFTQAGIVDGSAVYPRGGAGLQALDPERQLPQAPGQRVGRWIARPPALIIRQTHMDTSGQEGADGEDHGPGPEA